MNYNYIENITIEKFKGFEKFNINNLKRINLVGGGNNIGKTALLEACFLSSNSLYISAHLISLSVFNDSTNTIPNEIEEKLYRDEDECKFEYIKLLIILKQNRERINFLTQWLREETDLTIFSSFNIRANNNCTLSLSRNNLTHKYSNNKKIVVDISRFTDNKYYYKIYKKNHPPVINNSTFISPCNESATHRMVDKLKLNGEYSKINNYLKRLFNVVQVDVINNQVMLQRDGIYRNLSEFGDGVRHFLNIALVLLSNSTTTVYLDEIENGIHHSLFDILWEIIITTSKKNNIQIFAATHSQECIESYARVADKLQDKDISFIELGRNNDNNKITSITYDFEALMDEVAQDQEIRGW